MTERLSPSQWRDLATFWAYWVGDARVSKMMMDHAGHRVDARREAEAKELGRTNCGEARTLATASGCGPIVEREGPGSADAPCTPDKAYCAGCGTGPCLKGKPDPAALLPCPWCGAAAKTGYVRDGRRVYCTNQDCMAAGPPRFHGPVTMASAEDQAIAAWNTRAALQPQGPSADDAAVLDDMIEAVEFAANTGHRGSAAEFEDAEAAIPPKRAAVLARMSTPPGYKLVPVEPTWEMLNAAIDAHGLKLGCIAPLGFRMSPQMMFEKSYAAMLAAAPTEVK
jgi:hypothetical protein